MALQKLYPLKDAAPVIGLKLGSLRQYVSRGIIPSVRVGRKRLIPERVLERICEEGLSTKADGKAE
jgi:excisionase family DNA binding protein